MLLGIDCFNQPGSIAAPSYIRTPKLNPTLQNSAGSGNNKDPQQPELKLPYPKIGDVVQYPGKWEGERGIGQIRFLQRIQ
jgi:hypothetical protein